MGDLLLKSFSFFFLPSLPGLQVPREEGGSCNLTEGLHQIWPRLRRCLLKPGLTAGWTGNRPHTGLLLLLRADAPVLQSQSGNTLTSYMCSKVHEPGAIWRDLLGCCFRDDLFSIGGNSVSLSNYTHMVWLWTKSLLKLWAHALSEPPYIYSKVFLHCTVHADSTIGERSPLLHTCRGNLGFYKKALQS